MPGSKKFFILYFIILFFSLTGFVLAQRQLEINYPEIGGIKPTVTTISLPEYVKYIFNISIALAGLIIFGVLVYAGFRYLTSAGNVSAMQDAKERVGGAGLGILVLLGSYLILTTINPQLTFFNLPGLKGIDFFPSPAQNEKEKDILHYTEIPVGGLVADLFSAKRMASKTKVLDETKKSAEKVKNISEELKSLTDATGCGLTSPACAGGCEGGVCLGDPCPNRSSIEAKRSEMLPALSDSEQLRGLGYWPAKINIEFDDLKKIFQDLLDTESFIQGCFGSVSPQGRVNDIMGYTDFWQYREFLQNNNIIEGVEATRPWNYSADSGTFYCAEQFLSAPADLSGILPSEEELKNIVKQAPQIKEREQSLKGGDSFCGSEIKIGEAVDDAEKLFEETATLLTDILNQIPKEISQAEKLYSLTDPAGRCSASNCSVAAPCSLECADCPPEEPPLPPPKPGGFNPFSASEALAAGCKCGEICNEAQGPCSGEIYDNQAISDSVDLVLSAYNDIADQMKKFQDLVGADILKIFDKLNTAKNSINLCSNSVQNQKDFYLGKKVPWKDLYNCSQVKSFAQGDAPVFDEKTGQPITNCYSGEGKADNYFCCKSEINPSP